MSTVTTAAAAPVTFPTPAAAAEFFCFKLAACTEALGYNLYLESVHGQSTTEYTLSATCTPKNLATRGTDGLITLDFQMTGRETAIITGSSFDFDGLGTHTMKELTTDLDSTGYTPQLLAEALAETMRAAGYTA